MAERTYSQEEVEQMLQDHTDKLEARHFEEETKEVLQQINRRLTEANGYKNTIGKDVREVKEEVQDVKRRVISLEEARAKEAKLVQEKADRKREWFQEWWVRAFGIATILWEIINIYQSSNGSIHHIITGK